MALGEGMQRTVWMCFHLCVWMGRECMRILGSCGQMYGHGLQVRVSKTDEVDFFISTLQASMCLCTFCVCVCVCACEQCVLNSAEQVVRYHPNAVARQMAERATCNLFRPPGQTPASPH